MKWTMNDEQEFYILGLPIKTEIGTCRFLKVKEYPRYYRYLQTMAISKLQIIYNVHKMNKPKKPELDRLIERLNELSLYEIVVQDSELFSAYFNVMTKVFNDVYVMNKIDSNNFMYYRNLVLTMNCMKEKKINPNPEIQKFIEMKERLTNTEEIAFADIVSSVSLYKSYSEINNLTIYQLYMTFHRIGQFKNHDITALFATVPSDKKIQIESWSKHIDLFRDEEFGMSREKFKEKIGGIFK